MSSISTPDGGEAKRRAPRRLLSTRTLLICGALAVATGILAELSRLLGLMLQPVLPWLSFPAPLPWFLGIFVAVALFRLPGVALITGFIGMVVSFGGLVLCGAIITELVLLAFRYRRWSPDVYYLAAALIAVMNFGFMYLYADFSSLPLVVQGGALVARILIYIGYAWLALWTTERLARAGIRGRVTTE